MSYVMWVAPSRQVREPDVGLPVPPVTRSPPAPPTGHWTCGPRQDSGSSLSSGALHGVFTCPHGFICSGTGDSGHLSRIHNPCDPARGAWPLPQPLLPCVRADVQVAKPGLEGVLGLPLHALPLPSFTLPFWVPGKHFRLQKASPP